MTTSPLPTTSLRHLLGPEGPIAGALAPQGGYEERPQQLAMASAVAHALREGRHAMLEAGTGVGKSFAYLLPVLQHAAEHGTTVAVSTATIALQEQLVRKDLPLLAKVLPFEVSFALVKGRGNYLCTRRMHLALRAERGLFHDEARQQLEAIGTWSTQTLDGSRQDLPFRPRGDVWDQVRAESGNCLGRACEHYEGCHYQRSRRRAHSVRVLVLNHHVLMADLALRRSGASFLPDVQAVVVDEAHDLHDVAAEHLGARVSARGLGYQLGRLWSMRRKRGLLADAGLAGAREHVRAAQDASRGFFDGLGALADGYGPGQDTVSIEPGAQLPDACSRPLDDLADALLAASQELDDTGRRLEVASRARGVRAMAETVRALSRHEDPDQVRWIERSRDGTQVSICQAPVDVGPLLGEVLWDAHRSVILTSATLASGDPPDFAFVRGRLGIEAPLEGRIGSPYDHEKQVRLVLRGDLPDPSREARAYQAALPQAVLDGLVHTPGPMLVLFTSRRSMDEVAQALRQPLHVGRVPLWVQGERLERPALLDAFREEGGVLLGVASFWQGVDLPGDTLRHVMIARLPFEVPTHPLQIARQAQVVASGGNAFADLSLPLAALRLKQGFGRLIRRSSDSGTVTVLDSRLVTKHYGRYLLATLPSCPIERITR